MAFEQTLSQCEKWQHNAAQYRPVYRDYARTSACYRAYNHTITLPEWSRQWSTVLHETAHSLDRASLEAHGPSFMRKYIDLLVRYDVFTESELIESAKHYGLRIAE